MATKRKRKYRSRSSESGRYVTPDYAKEHPATTVRERMLNKLSKTEIGTLARLVNKMTQP